MIVGESPEDMHRRLTVLSVAILWMQGYRW
jgi:hypothetical protein